MQYFCVNGQAQLLFQHCHPYDGTGKHKRTAEKEGIVPPCRSRSSSNEEGQEGNSSEKSTGGEAGGSAPCKSTLSPVSFIRLADQEIRTAQSLSAKIGRSIERQMVSAASSSALTILKPEGDARDARYVFVSPSIVVTPS